VTNKQKTRSDNHMVRRSFIHLLLSVGGAGGLTLWRAYAGLVGLDGVLRV
jgi:hypothetical protein